MRHPLKLSHVLTVIVAIVATAVPAILADPAVRSLIANHPAVAGYMPVVSGVVYALWRAARDTPTTKA